MDDEKYEGASDFLQFVKKYDFFNYKNVEWGKGSEFEQWSYFTLLLITI